ncbi:MAG: nucleotide sugar dehydrogenase [Hyphomonas sp.]|uniref:nucleotide sugar dehydrogenase n=1 Tax=Hyphomonas sp. TaxID=87 RepID=UPI0025BFB94F|nr:nucleotide sugar dehydrogenase [Hyphomonas sp.]MBA4338920.1 nucleotide sugar dehydrogenase [Hyphomonas sp.]
MQERRKIAVIGLGYVGLPVAVSFAKAGFSVVGFEIDQTRVSELREGVDRTHEVSKADLDAARINYSADEAVLRTADFIIITVPTPIDDALVPDLGAVRAASRTVGRVLKRGDIVVYESTVYPGCTEEECAPILEQASGLRCGVDFTLGYSPERINPGDKEHRFETICKVVSGQDQRTLDIVAETYAAVVTAGVHRAPTIRVAEAAKVIENTQRDLNIALMNELSLILNRLGIDTNDVLEAAGTKWNFLNFRPGLVGGHCIGVDPYYLTHKAQKAGYHPEVVLAGRRVNDGMARHVAQECVRLLGREGRIASRATMLGITFKEDVPDVRNSKAIDIVRELNRFGVSVEVADIQARPETTVHEYGIELVEQERLHSADAVVLAVAHQEYRVGGWKLIQSLLKDGRGVVMDIKGVLPRDAIPDGIVLWRM